MNDVKFALRQLFKHKASSLLAVLILALGIGGTTAVFSVADKALLNPIPGRTTDRLVRIREVEVMRAAHWNASPPLITELAGHSDVIEALAYWWQAPEERRLRIAERTVKLSGAKVAPSFFELLELRPLAGRTFQPGDGSPEADRTIVISHGLWQQHFGGDGELMGDTIELDGLPYSVIGVMPPNVQFPFGSGQNQFWIPHRFTTEELHGEGAALNRVWGTLARLPEGASLSGLRARLEVIAGRRAPTLNEPNRRWIIEAQTARQALSGGELQQTVLSLLAVMVALLLIACANVGNLFLSRTLSRRGELGIRVALGAGRWRLARQLLVESLALAGIAAGAGLFVAWAGIVALEQFYLTELPRIQVVGLDWGVLGITCAMAIVTGVLFGMAPAWLAARTNVNQTLKETAAQHSGGIFQRLFQDGLVVVQVTAAVVLLAGAGWMTRSAVKLLAVNPGLEARGLYSVFYDTSDIPTRPVYDFRAAIESGLPREIAIQESWQATVDHCFAFRRAALERIRAIPGVQSVATSQRESFSEYEVSGRADPIQLGASSVSVVDGDYLGLVGARLLSGRLLTVKDAPPGEPGVVVNQKLASLCWPAENPLGKVLRHSDPPIERRVVGVIENLQDWSLGSEAKAVFYEPLERIRFPSLPHDVGSYVIRSALPAEVLREAVGAAGKDMLIPVELIQFYSVHDQLLRSTAPRRVMMWLLISLGGLGLLLSALGIYAVLAFAVARRIREVGIRMAMGAAQGQIRSLFVRRGARLVINGLALGLIGAFTGAQYIHSLLFEVDPWDPWAAAAVVLLLVGAAGLACWLPAHRAAKVDPMQALRCE
jgi:putative ABC transport system permease protein